MAEKCGKLQQFVKLFRRSECVASVSALTLNRAPKINDKKRKQQKKEQQKRADIEEVVKNFSENEIENSTFAFTISKQH